MLTFYVFSYASVILTPGIAACILHLAAQTVLDFAYYAYAYFKTFN